IGHMTIDSTGRLCKGGNYGCLEAYASGPAIAARAVEGIRPGTETSLPTYVNGDLSKITAQLVYEAAHDGDEYAREVVKDTAKFLGAGVASIINIFNPEVVVVCGGVTLAGDWQIVPLVKVGRDLAARANEFLGTLHHVAPGARFLEVPAPNNRVTLRYYQAERRCEQMSGGVPPWTWPELGPQVRDLDALYVN